MTFLAKTEFAKFFNRAVLVSAVLLLWPAIRLLRLPGWQALGIERNPRRWRHLALGFAASFALMLVLAAGLLVTDVYRFKTELPWNGLGKIALTAAVVSVIEE